MVRSLVGSYRASRSKEPVVVPDVEEKETVSIVSLPKDRTERIKTIDNWKESRKKKNVNDISCSDSVLSDISFSATPSSVPKEISGSSVGRASTHEFLLECDNGERIYVPSPQGMMIKSRCQYVQVALETKKNNSMFWGGSDSESVSSSEHRIVTMKKWSPRTARHMVELLSDGVTWIDNDQNKFVELLRACDEVNVRLYLGSPINYHDILDRGGTLRFFQLLDEEKYRFQLAGTIKSNQWMSLIQKGILLGLDSSLLMLSVETSSETDTESKDVQRRLSKCDGLYSEFSVYSNRSTINSLYTILSILRINDGKAKVERGTSGNKIASSEHFEESIQIVCKTEKGGLSERDWNMLWRMTSASYTLSTPEEERLLQLGENSGAPPLGNFRFCDNPLADCSSSTATSTTADRTETTSQESIDGGSTDSDGGSDESPIYEPPSKLYSTPSKLESKLGRASQREVGNRVKYETRTITGTSFVPLKHLFHPLNRPAKKSSKNNPSLLPASLSISNPTPDTLGRFLNACASTCKISGETITRIGYDILPPPSSTTTSSGTSTSTVSKNGILFFVSDTSQRVKEILNRMADYSGVSEVGEADFRLEQLRHN